MRRARSPISTRNSCRSATRGSIIPGRSTAATRRPTGRDCTALASLPNAIRPRAGYAFNTNNWPWTAAGPDSPQAKDYPRYMDTAGENARGVHAVRLLQDRRDFTAERLTTGGLRQLHAGFRAHDPELIAAYDASPRPQTGGTDRAVAKLGLTAGAPIQPRPAWRFFGATAVARTREFRAGGVPQHPGLYRARSMPGPACPRCVPRLRN